MAVLKITETRQETAVIIYKDYICSPVPTSFCPCYSSVSYDVILLGRGLHSQNDVGMGLLV